MTDNHKTDRHFIKLRLCGFGFSLMKKNWFNESGSNFLFTNFYQRIKGDGFYE